MALISESWCRALSLLLFLFLAVPIDALPKKKSAASTGGAATGAAAATTITKATDGSTILDKTVNIKYSIQVLMRLSSS